jgi:hypothetical protein
MENAGACVRRLSLVQSMEDIMRQHQAMAVAALLACTLAQAQSQPQDDGGRQARLRTLQKEIGAAYEEAKKACGSAGAAGRSACLKEARASYEQEMKNAPAQLDAAPGGSVQTTVQTTVGSSTSTTTTQVTR